jgi:hypothetical protein
MFKHYCITRGTKEWVEIGGWRKILFEENWEEIDFPSTSFLKKGERYKYLGI